MRPKLDWVPGVSTIDGTPRKAKAGVWGGALENIFPVGETHTTVLPFLSCS